MKKIVSISLATLAIALLSTGCAAKKKAIEKPIEVKKHLKHWGYIGEGAPEHWGYLKPEYRMCTEGKNQSPINIISTKKTPMLPLKIKYSTGSVDFVNNGHTVQVNFKEGSELYIDKKVYKLKQFHFHTPSENTLFGKHFPMEAHLVHSTDDGELAVISVMFSGGFNDNKFLAKFMNKLPLTKGVKNDLVKENLNAFDMMPEDKHFYRFNGSLTTPPCSEGVLWLVLKNPVPISDNQLMKFRRVLGNNNRPTQPINTRIILE
jgi:carbonic anhydrase